MIPATTVLVVDDFQPIRENICSVLKGAGYQVVGQASDGLEAVLKAEQVQPNIIVLDVALPKLNGIEASKQIAAVAPKSKVVFLSANDDSDVVQAVLSDGVCGYVLKSEMDRELVAALMLAMRNGRFISPRLQSQFLKVP